MTIHQTFAQPAEVTASRGPQFSVVKFPDLRRPQRILRARDLPARPPARSLACPTNTCFPFLSGLPGKATVLITTENHN